MERAGIAHGRRLEALDAKHAREKFVLEADKIATLAWMKAAQKRPS
jgi:hypothetical protein